MYCNSQCTCPVVNISQSTMLLCRTFIKIHCKSQCTCPFVTTSQCNLLYCKIFLKCSATHNALSNVVTMSQLMHCIVTPLLNNNALLNSCYLARNVKVMPKCTMQYLSKLSQCDNAPACLS